MYLEAEVYGLVFWAFLAVEGVTVLILLGLFLRSRNRALLWFGGQALLAGGGLFLLLPLPESKANPRLFHVHRGAVPAAGFGRGMLGPEHGLHAAGSLPPAAKGSRPLPVLRIQRG